MLTIGDMLKAEQPPTPATRAALDAKLAGLEDVLESLVTIYGDTLEAVSQCREMLALDEPEPLDDSPPEAAADAS